MNLIIKVYFDYICPYCVIAKKIFDEVIENEIKKGTNIEVKLMPFEICLEGDEKIDPINDLKMADLWKNEIIPLSNKLNMDLKIPNIIPHPYTNLTFQAFYFAKEYKKEKEFNDIVYKAFFYEDKDISKLEVITELCQKIGLDKQKCLEVLKKEKYKKIQDDYRKKVLEDKIEIVPTIIVGNTRLEGILEKENLENAIDKELKKNTA